jgi:hypothetical protein
MNLKPPIFICSKTGKPLPVLLKSIELYVPEDVEIYICGSDYKLPKHKTHNFEHTYDTGGKAWNFMAQKVFENHDYGVACADDAVLNPDSYQQLIEDLELLLSAGKNVGLLAARTNYAKGWQNIRYGHGELIGLSYEGESKILGVDYVAGIFNTVSKSTFIPYPPIDWYSDDIQCLDMINNGSQHYVSRAYVHHVGSMTYGRNYKECSDASKEWVKENRPELYKTFFGEE